jgi:uncharacterized protein (DUF1778 family)
MQIVRLFDEVALMADLQKSTLDLMHATSLFKAIKKLVEAYEIIDLNLEIEKRFTTQLDDPPWDLDALGELSKIRRELVIYYRPDFHPTILLDKYSSKMHSLFYRIQTRKNLSKPLVTNDMK